MKFEEALEQFAVELEKQYGKGDCIVKIALTPEVFREVMNNYEPDKELPVAPIVSGKNDHGEIINADYWHAPTDREMLCLAYGALKVHMQGRDNPVTMILDEYLFPKPVMLAAAPEAGAKE